ncbi:MAG: hypothetical protein AMJ62_07915 [Myxococcales bacterium SG8_38]|nr:MAG: hypothetical protein AMJ62_07915 [Myxococcales bacterium SG8_38]
MLGAVPERFAVEPGACYALDQHDRHTLEAERELELVCLFDPPVTGTEIHDPDGAYRLVEDDA